MSTSPPTKRSYANYAAIHAVLDAADVLREKGISGADHSIMITIARHLGSNWEPCWLTIENLAKESHTSPATVSRRIPKLKELSLVVEAGVHKSGAVKYSLNLKGIGSVPQNEVPQSEVPQNEDLILQSSVPQNEGPESLKMIEPVPHFAESVPQNEGRSNTGSNTGEVRQGSTTSTTTSALSRGTGQVGGGGQDSLTNRTINPAPTTKSPKVTGSAAPPAPAATPAPKPETSWTKAAQYIVECFYSRLDRAIPPDISADVNDLLGLVSDETSLQKVVDCMNFIVDLSPKYPLPGRDGGNPWTWLETFQKCKNPVTTFVRNYDSISRACATVLAKGEREDQERKKHVAMGIDPDYEARRKEQLAQQLAWFKSGEK